MNPLRTARARLRTWLPGVLVTGLLLSTPGVQQAVVAQARPDSYELAMQRLDGFMELVEELRGLLDSTQFVVGDLAFELAFEEPATISEWVHDNIGFEQYPGLLRGARGTLMSRAGNALDQAVLLATLLNDAGFETRIARGVLEEEQAVTLLSTMSEKMEVPPLFPDEAAARAVFEEMAEVMGLPVEDVMRGFEEAATVAPTSDPLYVEATTTSRELLGVLADNDFGFVDNEDGTSLASEALDYFWVESRVSPDDAWDRFHPAWPGADEPAGLDAEEYFTEVIPEGLQHRIRVEAFVERKMGSDLEESLVMAPWERPAANAQGTLLHYTNLADSLTTAADFADVDDALARVNFLTPLFAGGVAPGASIFDLTGATVDPEAANNQAAGVFQNVGNAFGDAAAGIANEDPDTFVTLSSFGMRITVEAPDGEQRIVERRWLDKIGPAHRASGSTDIAHDLPRAEVIRRLTQSATILIATGDLPPSFVLDAFLERLLSARPLLELEYAQALGAESAVESEDLAGISPSWVGLLALANMFQLAANESADVTYRSAPNVLAHYQDMPVFSDVRSAVDIIWNPRRSVKVNPSGQVELDPIGVFESGVWETRAEGALQPGDTIQASANVFEAFETARERGVPLRFLTPADRAQIASLEVDADTKAMIQRDIDAGYAVLVPHAPVFEEGEVTTAWWRIDRATGETLGIGSNGLGTDLAMYGMLLTIGYGGFMAGCMAVREYEQGRMGMKAVQCSAMATTSASLVGGGGVLAGAFAATFAAPAVGGFILGILALTQAITAANM